jgi:long-chain acyl-CoA synthetase
VDLGFDSLMFVELAAAIEEATGAAPAPEVLFEARDVRELTRVAGHDSRGRVETTPVRAGRELTGPQPRDREIRVPRLVRAVGGAGLDVLQHVLYEAVLRARYEGRANVPSHTNFIVAANHASHLDMGLVKFALGGQGRDLVALAAADYFFDDRYKRAYVENFTNLIPIERGGDFRRALRHARAFIEQGYNILIFPEGTRSATGEIAEFKPAAGYLALSGRVGILPVYLHGTREALPKGAALLRARDVGARIGRLLTIEHLEGLTRGLPNSAAHRLIAALVRHEVLNLRDGTTRRFDAAAVGRPEGARPGDGERVTTLQRADDASAADEPAVTGD